MVGDIYGAPASFVLLINDCRYACLSSSYIMISDLKSDLDPVIVVLYVDLYSVLGTDISTSGRHPLSSDTTGYKLCFPHVAHVDNHLREG